MGKRRLLQSWAAVGLTAVMAVSAVLGAVPCGSQTVASAAVSGELAHVTVHDPSIVVGEKGTYYAFGTHITTTKSKDLAN